MYVSDLLFNLVLLYNHTFWNVIPQIDLLPNVLKNVCLTCHNLDENMGSVFSLFMQKGGCERISGLFLSEFSIFVTMDDVDQVVTT